MHAPVLNSSPFVRGTVMVIGGGVAGIQAFLYLSALGYKVCLVGKSAAIGGVMARLAKTFPTNDCSLFFMDVRTHGKGFDAARNLPDVACFTDNLYSHSLETHSHLVKIIHEQKLNRLVAGCPPVPMSPSSQRPWGRRGSIGRCSGWPISVISVPGYKYTRRRRPPPRLAEIICLVGKRSVRTAVCPQRDQYLRRSQ